jgi:hypothetical protein
VIEAIAPAVGLEATIARWNEIAAALGERNRKRKPQISENALRDSLHACCRR